MVGARVKGVLVAIVENLITKLSNSNLLNLYAITLLICFITGLLL